MITGGFPLNNNSYHALKQRWKWFSSTTWPSLSTQMPLIEMPLLNLLALYASIPTISVLCTKLCNLTLSSFCMQTHSEFEVRYNELLRERGYTYLANGEQCFDGVMVLAMALNSTISGLYTNYF